MNNYLHQEKEKPKQMMANQNNKEVGGMNILYFLVIILAHCD